MLPLEVQILILNIYQMASFHFFDDKDKLLLVIIIIIILRLPPILLILVAGVAGVWWLFI
jgi:hypothetical protein